MQLMEWLDRQKRILLIKCTILEGFLLNSFQPKLHWESIFILPHITTSHYRKPAAAIKEFSPVAMRRQGLLNPRAYVNATKIPHGLHFTEPASVAPAIFLHMGAQIHNRNVLVRAKIPSIRKIVKWGSVNTNCTIQASDYEGMLDENQGESSDEDEDDELCPVECVREFKTDKEFLKILERAKETDSLVVVDFYRTSCGSCKYIEQGFTKLCRGSADQEAPVIFLKHNVSIIWLICPVEFGNFSGTMLSLMLYNCTSTSWSYFHLQIKQFFCW